MYQNIIFDCSDTLLYQGCRDHLTALAGDRERAMKIHTTLFLSEPWKDYDRGRLTDEEAEAKLLPLLEPEDRELGLYHIRNWHLHYSVIEGMEALIEELKAKGCRLYVLSDFPACFERLWEKFDIFRHFDGRVVSFENQWKKHEGKPFEIILEKYDLKAQDCLFVDDGLVCVETAQKYGFATHQFTDVPTLRKVLGLI